MGVSFACVDYGGDLDALCGQIRGRAPAVIIVGKDRDTLARGDAEAVDIGAHGPGQHHAGPVVHREGDRALRGPGGQQGAFGIDAPQHLPGLAVRVGEVVGHALQRAVDAVIVGTDRRWYAA